MTNRGHFESILTAVVTAVAATSPAKTKATASQRIPLCEFRFPEGDTACYQAASETDPIDGLTATDAEFIPTGECRVFLVKTPEARTLTEPLAVPLRFGTAGDTVGLGSQMAERGQRMNRSDAVAAMMRHNRGVIGRGGVLAAGMADRMLHSALMTTGQEIPQRFFHRRARAVAIGMISPTLGETLDDLRWIRNRIVHHASDAGSLWLPPLVDRVGQICEGCEQPQDAKGFRDTVAASIGELLVIAGESQGFGVKMNLAEERGSLAAYVFSWHR